MQTINGPKKEIHRIMLGKGNVTLCGAILTINHHGKMEPLITTDILKITCKKCIEMTNDAFNESIAVSRKTTVLQNVIKSEFDRLFDLFGLNKGDLYFTKQDTYGIIGIFMRIVSLKYTSFITTGYYLVVYANNDENSTEKKIKSILLNHCNDFLLYQQLLNLMDLCDLGKDDFTTIKPIIK